MKTELSQQLRGMPLFAEFSDDEIATFVDLAEHCSFKDGELIVEQDSTGDAMFLIVTGSVKVSHHVDGKVIDLAVLEGGSFFGEIALVDHGPRSADVLARGDCSLLKIPQGTLRALAGVYPNAAFKLLLTVGRVLVARMRAGNKKYIDSLLMLKNANH